VFVYQIKQVSKPLKPAFSLSMIRLLASSSRFLMPELTVRSPFSAPLSILSHPITSPFHPHSNQRKSPSDSSPRTSQNSVLLSQRPTQPQFRVRFPNRVWSVEFYVKLSVRLTDTRSYEVIRGACETLDLVAVIAQQNLLYGMDVHSLPRL
jgi:hypothetical protein